MKKEIFRGAGTALITPFCDGRIDYPTLKLLIERQIEAGVAALIIGGTTGEAATLDDTERYELYRFCKENIAGRCAVIFGTGTNDTKKAIQHTGVAEKIGCDGVLVVTPYYNKGTKEGICRHYETIADSTDLPIILYNVPKRTGVLLDVPTVERLAERENIVAIKEADDSQDKLLELAALKGISLYAGNDSAAYSVLSLGGLGVISVVSNILPKDVAELCREYFAGNHTRALEIQKKLLPIISAMFLETNPAPVKYAMSKMGLCREDMRLPMWLVTDATKKKIDTVLSVSDIDAQK